MPGITVEAAWALAQKALVHKGFESGLAKTVSEEFIVAELSGVKTHGLGKLVSLNFGDLKALPTRNKRGVVTTVNGNGCNGFVLLRSLAEDLASQCRWSGAALAVASNFSRYSSLYPYTNLIAKTGCIGVLLNSAGPAAVTPFRSIDPVTGTNPICFSFPTGRGGIQTFDLATSSLVWGAIRQASIENSPLPYGPFFDASGDITTVPSNVNAVRAFGDSKGFALNLAIEILGGILTGGKAGQSCQSEFDCGALLIALDPDLYGLGSKAFFEKIVVLFDEIRSCRPEHEGDKVRVPGDARRHEVSLLAQKNNLLLITDGLAELLQRMADGEDITELASNPLYN